MERRAKYPVEWSGAQVYDATAVTAAYSGASELHHRMTGTSFWLYLMKGFVCTMAVQIRPLHPGSPQRLMAAPRSLLPRSHRCHSTPPRSSFIPPRSGSIPSRSTSLHQDPAHSAKAARTLLNQWKINVLGLLRNRLGAYVNSPRNRCFAKDIH